MSYVAATTPEQFSIISCRIAVLWSSKKKQQRHRGLEPRPSFLSERSKKAAEPSGTGSHTLVEWQPQKHMGASTHSPNTPIYTRNKPNINIHQTLQNTHWSSANISTHTHNLSQRANSKNPFSPNKHVKYTYLYTQAKRHIYSFTYETLRHTKSKLQKPTFTKQTCQTLLLAHRSEAKYPHSHTPQRGLYKQSFQGFNDLICSKHWACACVMNFTLTCSHYWHHIGAWDPCHYRSHHNWPRYPTNRSKATKKHMRKYSNMDLSTHYVHVPVRTLKTY